MNHVRHSNIYNIPGYFQVGLVGAGGIGAMTALVFAKMGVPLLNVWDDDVVSETNIPTQLHPVSDVGNYKVDSLKETLEHFSDEIFFTGVHARITPDLQHISQYAFQNTHYNLFVTAVDSIEARQDIWRQMREYDAKVDWFLDLRMAAQEYQHFLLQMSDHGAAQRYAEMLFSMCDADLPETPCTEKATFFTASAAAGHAGVVLKDIVRGEAKSHRLVHYIADEGIAKVNL
jgi:hypothetical protein